MILQQSFEQMIRSTAFTQKIIIHDASIRYAAHTLFNHLTCGSLGQHFLSAAMLQAHLMSEAKLQIIGDECLITAGMFPEKTSQLFSVHGYIALGQAAYEKLGRIQPGSATNFTQISTDFPYMVRVLHSCRSHATPSIACNTPSTRTHPTIIQPQSPSTRH